MSPRFIHVEQLLGRRVRDADGRVVGRIEEIVAKRVSGEIVVHEYLLGPRGLLERLALPAWRLPIGHGRGKRYRIPWDQLALSDPERPSLRCTEKALGAPRRERGPSRQRHRR